MVGATKTRGAPKSPDAKNRLRQEIIFSAGVATLALLGFVLAFWAVQLTASLIEKKIQGVRLPYASESSLTDLPLQRAEENLLPSSFTDLFSSTVYVSSTSEEIKHNKSATGSYFVPQGAYSRARTPLFIESVNLNTYDFAVVKAKISEVDLQIKGGGIYLFLSNDGVAWGRVNVGEFFRFDNPGGRLLLWRAEILPSLNSELHFSLDRIRIDYGVKQ